VEYGGKYWKYILSFDKRVSGYTVWKKEIDGPNPVNFVSLPHGLSILASDDHVVLFKDPVIQKELRNTPVSCTTRLYHDGVQVFFSEGNRFYQIKMV
jgi:hypothetical protein